MSGEKTFEYGGYHFTPVRPFRKDEGDFLLFPNVLKQTRN